MFSNNAAGINNASKSFCLKSEIMLNNAAIFTIQETNFKKKGKFQVKGYNIFESIRKKEKGDVLIGVHQAFKPVLISEYNDEFELLVVEITVENKQLRLISGVGPQENQTEANRLPFFLTLEKEIAMAEMDGKSIIIEMDANSKLGPDRIPHVKHDMSPNGRLLSGIIDKHALFVVNGSSKCVGTITRKRVTIDSIEEESTIDLVLISEDLKDNVDKLIIDEDRNHALTKLVKNRMKVESVHNPLITSFKWSWNKSNSKQDIVMFNLKNKDCQRKFREATTNNTYLSSVFEDDKGDINKQTDIFMKRLNRVLHKCFKRVRITEHIDKDTDDLYKLWRKLQSQNKVDELKIVEDKLAEQIDKNYRTIQSEVGQINTQEDAGFHTGKLWTLKKKFCPRAIDPPMAMVDDTGNLVTSAEAIKELSLNKLAVERLRNRDIKDDLQHLRLSKEELCRQNLDKAKNNKTPDWKQEDVDSVLKHLKVGVSRDPLGHANELFHPNVAGTDLRLAILKTMNKIKSDQVFPKCFEPCNITSLWKSKGPKNSFESYRGVFRVTVFRNILDRLI